jgi:uncharacterized protein
LLFEDVIRSLYGGSARIDVIGNAVPDYLVIDTDGSIRWNDALKVCDEGVAETGLNVAHHSFEAVDQASALSREVLSDNSKLNALCQNCPELRTCGGGFLPHRYSRARGFDNPSIWCADLLSFISHVRNAVFS